MFKPQEPQQLQAGQKRKRKEDEGIVDGGIASEESPAMKHAAKEEKGEAFSIILTNGKNGEPQIHVSFPPKCLYKMVEKSADNSKMTVSLKSDPNSKLTFGHVDGKTEYDVSQHSSSSPEKPHQLINPDGTRLSFRIENGNIVDLQGKGFSTPVEFITRDGRMALNPETGKLQKVEQQKAAAPDVSSNVLKDAAAIGKGLAASGVSTASADTAKQSLPAPAVEQSRGR